MITNNNAVPPCRRVKILLIILILFICIFLLITCKSKNTQQTSINTITPQKAYEMTQKLNQFVILDVRTEEEFIEKRISGSILIPYDKIKDRAENELPYKTMSIFLHCRTGVRSAIAANVLAELGYENIYNFKEFANWQGSTASNLDISQYNLSLQNTISIFLLQDENGYFFCIPVQYMGDYQISGFSFTSGNISFASGYNLNLSKENTNISIYLNEAQDENGSLIDNFILVNSDENGNNFNVTTINNKQNHYYIFIERHLTQNELLNLLSLYEIGNVTAGYSIWYDLTIDNNEQNDSGLQDNFSLYNGQALNPSFYPPNLNFFKAKYLK